MGDVEVATPVAAELAPREESGGAAKDEGHSLNALQQHLQLEAFDGKYLTSQEILLLQLYQSMQPDGGKHGGAAGLNGAAYSSHDGQLSISANPGGSGGLSNAATTPGAAGGRSTPSGGAMGKLGSASATTPKRQLPSDRERVQNFLLQRQSSVGGSATTGGPAPRGAAGGSGGTVGVAATSGMSAIERAKLVMAKKAGTGAAKPLARPTSSTGASSTAVKRVNPLADILKGGSGSVVGGVQPSVAKRPRTKSDLRPGEIRINGGRSSIQLPVESFLRNEDWDSATASALDIVLPEVAFATNNTLIIHATMPQRSMRFCFNISTQSSMLSGAPYPGTVLYHFNPRRQRGCVIIQNSNIDGRWGCSQPLPRNPITFGEPFTLRLTVVPSGFLVFIEEIFQDEFKHRVPIREGENLVLTVPTQDESGNPEGVIVHNVWWGHAEPPANIETLRRGIGGGPGGSGYQRGPRGFDGDRGDRDRDRGGYRGDRGGPGGGGGRFGGNPHPFEVYVGNLPPGTSREELSFLFQYLGYETVRITQRGFGFVTLRSSEDMHRAVEDLDGREFKGMKLKVSVAMAPK